VEKIEIWIAQLTNLLSESDAEILRLKYRLDSQRKLATKAERTGAKTGKTV
jgi:hypothetical protein